MFEYDFKLKSRLDAENEAEKIMEDWDLANVSEEVRETIMEALSQFLWTHFRPCYGSCDCDGFDCMADSSPEEFFEHIIELSGVSI